MRDSAAVQRSGNEPIRTGAEGSVRECRRWQLQPFWDSEYVTNRRAEVRLANMEVLPRAHFLPVCYATSGPRAGASRASARLGAGCAEPWMGTVRSRQPFEMLPLQGALTASGGGKFPSEETRSGRASLVATADSTPFPGASRGRCGGSFGRRDTLLDDFRVKPSFSTA